MQFSFTQVLLLWMLFIMAFGTTFLMLMDEVTACSCNGGKNNYNQKRNNGPNTFKRSFKHTHIALFEKSVKSR